MTIWENATAVLVGTFATGMTLGWFLRRAVKPASRLPLGESLDDEGMEDDDDDCAIVPGALIDDGRGEIKMVMCIRMDLKMGKGKIAAQCAHAAVGAYKSGLKFTPNLLQKWERSGQPKITVKVDNDEQLVALSEHAQSLGILSYVIHDAGRTQIQAGSRTVLAVGPAPGHLVDKVTGHLKLL